MGTSPCEWRCELSLVLPLTGYPQVGEHKAGHGDEQVLERGLRPVPLRGLPHFEPLSADGDEAASEQEDLHEPAADRQLARDNSAALPDDSSQPLKKCDCEDQCDERLPDNDSEVGGSDQSLIGNGPPFRAC